VLVAVQRPGAQCADWAGVFTERTSRQIALALKRAADRSRCRIFDPFHSAMPLRTFVDNRARKSLLNSCKQRLEKTRAGLRILHGKK
jgi:Protein of unknown function (DUF3175)